MWVISIGYLLDKIISQLLTIYTGRYIIALLTCQPGNFLSRGCIEDGNSAVPELSDEDEVRRK